MKEIENTLENEAYNDTAEIINPSPDPEDIAHTIPETDIPDTDILDTDAALQTKIDALYHIEEARLTHYFGPTNWPNMRASLKAWGECSLPPALFDELSSNYEGVILLHKMMVAAQDQPLLNHGTPQNLALNENDLRQMMRDPRYWRDQDPHFRAKVAAGYRHLYPDETL